MCNMPSQFLQLLIGCFGTEVSLNKQRCKQTSRNSEGKGFLSVMASTTRWERQYFLNEAKLCSLPTSSSRCRSQQRAASSCKRSVNTRSQAASTTHRHERAVKESLSSPDQRFFVLQLFFQHVKKHCNNNNAAISQA